MQQFLSWLSACPALDGELLNLNFLPSYSGWSLVPEKLEIHTDILGSRRTVYKLKLQLRQVPSDNDARVAALTRLDEVAAWIPENPPDDCRALVDAGPSFEARAGSGAEDFSLSFRIEEL